ncbi:MAG: uracil-DNA glycosylase family protein [Thermoanaerobaculia bacterium]
MSLEDIADDLAAGLRELSFAPPVAYVYNPLEYARRPYRRYLEMYGQGKREVLFIGMNPGPWGMAQTGIPFGAVEPVTGWLGILDKVDKPERQHPKRPVRGFDCPRNEVSGLRVWHWARDTFGTPGVFFRRFFIANYCPLLFLAESGRNLTPDKLRAADREALVAPCDRALRRTVEELQPRRVIGVGVWAEGRARMALHGLDVEIGRILHPSPASPAANRGWAEAATRQLREQGIRI